MTRLRDVHTLRRKDIVRKRHNTVIMFKVTAMHLAATVKVSLKEP